MQIAPNGSPLPFDKDFFEASLLNKRKELDQQEKSNIVQVLNDRTAKRAEIEPVDLHYAITPRIAGSTFDHAQEFARIELLKMTETDAFLALREKYAFSADAVVCVDEKARLRALDESSWFEMTRDFQTTSFLQDDLKMLSECTAQTGGYVFSGEFIGVEQWLRFHNYTLPTTVAETKNLIAFLQFQMPASPTTGDYHELLMEPAESAFHLSTADRQTIRQVIDETTQGRASLLQHIAIKNFSLIPDTIRRERAADYLENFLDKPKARALGSVLHERLGWHLDADDPQVAGRQIKCLVVTALILDLVADVDKHAKVIAGYELYQPANTSRTASQVIEELEKHLIANTLMEPHNAPLAAHILLSGAAPQFLVQQVPAELTIGKPGWVVLTQAVALIELAAPGASRLMHYDEIKTFSDLSPVSAQQRALHEMTAITPIIDWAMLNGILPYSVDTDYDVETFTKAATHFSQYVEALNEVETGISAIPPDRRGLALQALKRVLPAGDYLERRMYKFTEEAGREEQGWLDVLAQVRPGSWDNRTEAEKFARSRVGRLRASILDLYMSDDLSVDGRFTDKFVTTGAFSLPEGAFSRLSELESVDDLFDKAFEQYYQKLQKSFTTIIKIAITNLPEHDRNMLSNGFITLYTVRKEVNPLNSYQETPRHRNAAKGRYGIILGCQHNKDFRCYELFLLRGLCRERPDLAAMLRTSGVVFDDPSLSYEGAQTDFLEKNFEQQWPLDVSAYLDGSEPTTAANSSAVVEKLWHFALVSDDVRPVPAFFSRALDALAEGVLGCHPVASREELYASLNTPTELQQMRAHNEAVNETLINVIVPFKKCIEDINSGDASRVSEGVGGCILDGLALVGLVVGFGATVASIVGKTTSTTAKVLSIGKAGAHLSISLFNPLDGLPTLALQGTRLAKRGVLLLSKHGLNAVETATGQLRKLTGSAQSYDLIKAAQKSDLLQGTWRSAGDLGDPINLVALERNRDWHALNLKVGGPWGPKLKNFKVIAAPFRQLFDLIHPFSYTRAYMKRAMPLAKAKLDNAIQLLSTAPDDEVRLILKYVFGHDSDEVLNYLLANLKVMRKDLDSVTLANMSFKRGSEAVAGLRSNAYKRWKASLQSGAASEDNTLHFLAIYKDGMDDLYRISKYDDTRIADTLIHEMSHGGPQTLDFYYGYLITSGSRPAPVDAAGLIDFAKDAHKAHPDNIANPHFQSAQPPAFTEFQAGIKSQPELVRNHPALLNADSYSLAVSLLDQWRTNPEELMWNLINIQSALQHAEGTSYKFIQGQLPIQLAKSQR